MPGTRAPPPLRKILPTESPSSRVIRNALARSMPTATSSADASTKLSRFSTDSRACTTSSACSAVRPRSLWRSSRIFREPKGMSRVRIGTPSSRMFTLVVSWPTFTSATMPSIASG